MGHHYVPQEYLRGFSARNDHKRVWLYSRNESPKLVAIKKVAQEKDFYDSQTESDLNKLSERRANPYIACIRQGHPLSADGRECIFPYIATMMMRVPHHRKKAWKILPSALEEVGKEIRSELANAERNPSFPIEKLEQLKERLQRALGDFAKVPPPGLLTQMNSPWPLQSAQVMIAAMQWRILTTDGKSDTFITSDNPCCFFEGFGLKNLEAEITLPLSPTRCLHGSWQKNTKGGFEVTGIKNFVVREINRRTLNGTTRFAFSHSMQEWISRIISKSDLMLNKLRWTDRPNYVHIPDVSV